MTDMRAALVPSHVASGRTEARGNAARFECLNFGFAVGTGNGVVSRVWLKISARFLRHAVLRLQAVPTNPLMPNLAQIGRVGAQKQLHKGLCFQEWLVTHQMGKLHLLDNKHALCVCASTALSALRMQGAARDSLASLARPGNKPAAPSLLPEGLQIRPPTGQRS